MKQTEFGLKLISIILCITMALPLCACSNDEPKQKQVFAMDTVMTLTAYGKNADAGLDGVVCSPLEAGKVHEKCGDRFLTVTPGVRFAGGEVGDQKRVTTPLKARELGSDYIVVGRPITAAEDPVKAYERCCRQFLLGYDD